VLTANCAASLSRGRGLPAGFSVSRQRLVVGKKPSWIQRMARALGDIGS
jgi:hypothetical protein